MAYALVALIIVLFIVGICAILASDTLGIGGLDYDTDAPYKDIDEQAKIWHRLKMERWERERREVERRAREHRSGSDRRKNGEGR